MTNPNKYETLPMNLVASMTEHFIGKLQKRKTRIEASAVITFIDAQGREIEVFYRVIDCCDNAQTDLSGDNYTIEQTTYKGRRFNLSGRGEQVVLNWLNRENPSAVKFQRA